ncbi:MAG TPA: patatin-like phospholipase family protein [Polyangiales bacterium]|nr:patatin-like phospholipase family protein [Polyangiales bacterium]
MEPTLREWLREEPFTLVMSSGFFGFYAHTGVLRVLEEEGLLPARAAGASAGALVTAAWSAGVAAERLSDRLGTLERRDYWDPGPGLGLLRGQRFASLLDGLLPVRTFDECRIPVALSVFDVAARATRVIDRGALAPAIQASCTVPVMFQPVRHQGRALLDGGILDRPGLAGVPVGERVFYHHLSSRWLGYTVPSRPGMVALEIEGLPGADPFRMHRGPLAMDLAASATRRALSQPVSAHMRS